MNRKPRMRHIMMIVEAAAKKHGVVGVFGSTLRPTKKAARWKHMAMLLCREAGHSTARIGVTLGRDHSTIISGIASMRKLIEEQDEYAVMVDRETRALLAETQDCMFGEMGMAKWRELRLKLEEETAKLAPAVVNEHAPEIRRLRRASWSVNSLAKRFEMEPRQIEQIIGETIFHDEVSAQ